MHSQIGWFVVCSDWMLVGHTAFDVDPDLARFLVDAFGHWTLHELSGAEVFESSAIEDVFISQFIVLAES